MKKSAILTMTLLLVLFSVFYAARDVAALDAPHNADLVNYKVSCEKCHISVTATDKPAWVTLPTTTDNTLFNNLCTSCHYSGSTTVGISKYEDIKTHSAQSTSSSRWSNNWTVECRVCHSPHNQLQQTGYANDALNTVISGSVASLVSSPGSTTSSLVSSAGTFTTDYYTGYLLIPNTVYPAKMYRIISNNATSFTVAGYISPSYTSAGKTYSIRYGKLLRSAIKYTSPTYVNTAVKLFKDSGENSFATSTNASTSLCMVCHTATKYFTRTGVTDSNGAHPAAAGAKCTTCHKHKDGFKASGCAGCHGQSGSTGAPLVSGDLVVPASGHTEGAHAKHVVDRGITNCDTCHAGSTMPDLDNVITISFSGNATGGTYTGAPLNAPYVYSAGIATNGAQSCSTVYCHSSGQAADGGAGAPVYATPLWNVTSSGACLTCHETTLITTGSHSQHLNTAGVTGCGNCHTGAADNGSSYVSANHVNKQINVANTYSAAGTPGNGYGSCSTASCHGSGSPTWGQDFTNIDTCTKCHGKPTLATDYTPTAAAPGAAGTGVDTGRNTTGAKVGAHRSHLEPSTTYNYTLSIDCEECHGVLPTAFTDAGHANGITEVPLTGPLAMDNERFVAGTPTYSAAQSQCSNVYCHDNTRFKHGYPGGPNSNTTPTWNNAVYLGANKAINCGRCHGNPPGGAHPAASANACKACHPSANAAGDGFDDVSKHANGIVEGGGCDGCHGNPPTVASYGASGMVGLGAGSGDPTGATNPVGPGAHNKHVNADPAQGRNIKCDACHKGTAMPAAETKIDMGFYISSETFTGFNSAATVTTGDFTGSNGLINGYTWTTNSPGTTVSTGSNTNNTCSSVYCHGGGATGKANPLTGGTNTKPNWAGTSQAACGTCHGGSSFTTAAANPPTTGGHVKHAGSANLGLACNKCHASTPADMTHVNGSVSWKLDETDARIGASAVYNSAASGTTTVLAPSASYGSCDTIYCHSDALSSPTYTQPNWGGGPVPCGSCHKAAPAPTAVGAEQNTGAHLTHVSASKYNKACSTCHKNAGTGTSKHADRAVDVSFTQPFTYGAAVSYSGTTNPGDAFGDCSNVYCHSTAQAPGGTPLTGAVGEYKLVTWGSGTVNCGSCHEDMSATNDLTLGTHKRHTNTPGVAEYECSTCHGAGYSSTSVNYATHANGMINTSFTGTAAGTTYSHLTNTPGMGYGNCSTSKCHGQGIRNWGEYTSLPTCEKCHGTLETAQSGTVGIFKGTDGSASGSSVGVHVSHLRSKHGLADPILCSQCHIVPANVNDAGHNDTLQPAELIFSQMAVTGRLVGGGTGTFRSAMTPSYNSATKTCSNTYCHAGVRITNDNYDDLGPQGTKPTPTWTDTAYLGGANNGCDACHAYPPAYPHPQGANAVVCGGCHSDVDPSTNKAILSAKKNLHLNGEHNWEVDECTGCHSVAGGKPLIGAHLLHTDPDVFLSGRRLSGVGDTNYEGSWRYDIVYGADGFPKFGCGFCHPMSDPAIRNNLIVELELDPAMAPAGSVMSKNSATAFVTRVTGSSVTCSGVYCHSNGYMSPGTNSYVYKDTPDWYSVTTQVVGTTLVVTSEPWSSVDRCAQCHGNSPNTGGTVGSPAHAKHVMVGIHQEDIFSGTTGTMTLAAASGAVHGDPNNSTVVSCNVCHSDTVTVSANDSNAVCSSCHTASPKGAMVLASGKQSHVNGTVNVVFTSQTITSRAQMRDDIASVPSVSASWNRANGYKAVNSADYSKTTPSYVGGTCSTVACHNGTPMEWNTAGPLSCNACHRGLPQ